MDVAGTIFAANSVSCHLFGYDAGELDGKQVRVILPQANQKTDAFGVLSGLRDNPDGMNTIEAVGLKKDDTEFPVELVLTACGTEYVCQLRDLSRRQMSENMDGILHNVLRRVIRGQSYEEFCLFLCEKIVELLGCPLVWIGRKAKDGAVCVTAKAGELSEGFPVKPIRWDDLTEKFGPTGQAIRTKRTVVVELLDDKVVDTDGREHIRQIIVFPLLTHKGVDGVLEIHSGMGKLDKLTIQRMETFSLRVAMAM